MPKSSTQQSTTAQPLGALLKSARDIMHKDIRLRQGYGGQERLNGDLDRLPMLTLRSSRREEAQTEKSEIGNQDWVRASSPRLLQMNWPEFRA